MDFFVDKVLIFFEQKTQNYLILYDNLLFPIKIKIILLVNMGKILNNRDFSAKNLGLQSNKILKL